jgi:hypothetical protein
VKGGLFGSLVRLDEAFDVGGVLIETIAIALRN